MLAHTKRHPINIIIDNRVFLLKKEMKRAVLLFLQAINAKELKMLNNKNAITPDEFRNEFLSGRPAFAINLRTARKRMGLSQVKLAAMTKIDRSNLNSYESGKKKMGIKVAKKLAHYLKSDYRLFLYQKSKNDSFGSMKKRTKIRKDIVCPL